MSLQPTIEADGNPNPNMRLDASGHVLTANTASIPLLQRCVSNGIAPPEWRQIASTALAACQPQTLEVKSGERTYEFTAVPACKQAYVSFFGIDITERKRLEQALSDSEERFRSVLSNSFDAPYRRNLQTDRYDYLSPVIERITGWSMEDMTTASIQTVLARVHPDDLSAVLLEIERTTAACQTGQVATGELEYRFRCRDSEYRWIGDQITVLADGAGRPLYRLGTFRDIDERKRAIEALRASEDRYRSLFNAMTEGFAIHEIICDEEGEPVDYRFLDINPAFERLTGLRRDEVVGRTHNEVLPDDSPSWARMYGEVALTGAPAHFDNYSPALKRHYEVFAYRPAPGQFAVIFMDITAHKQMEEALRVNLAKYAVLFDSFPLGITITDADGHVLETNREAERILSVTEEQHTQRRIDSAQWHIIRTDGTPMPAGEYASVRALREKRRVENVEMGIVQGNGSVTWISVTAEPLALEGYGVVITYGDITARKHADAERERLLAAEAAARREAERASELKLQFLAMISHELRTPLTSIKGFATTLLADDVTWDAASQQEFIGIIDQEADKLTEMIDQLLDLSRMQAGTLRVNPRSRSLYDIVTAALPHVEALTYEHSLRVQLPPDLPVVRADPQRITQVLINLVSNAAKYAPPGTPITLSAVHAGGHVEVSVSDEGPGIPSHERAHLFEPFHRGEGERTRLTKGVGMGLAICKGLVEAHGGRLWLRDEQQRGATFTFTLHAAAGY